MVHLLLGSLAQSHGQHRLAEPHFRRALDILQAVGEGPLTSEDSFHLFEEIFRVPWVVRKLIEVEPEDFQTSIKQFAATSTHFLLGVTMGCQSRVKEAEGQLRTALDIVHENPSVLREDMIHEYLDWLQQQQALGEQPTQADPRSRVEPSTSGNTIVDWLNSSMDNEFCKEPQLVRFDLIVTPQIRAAQGRCKTGAAGKDERAACRVLRGVEHLASQNVDAAAAEFLEAHETYLGSEDYLGAWITQFLSTLAAHSEGDVQLAETHIRKAQAYVRLVADPQYTIHARSFRLHAEVTMWPDELLSAAEAAPGLLRDTLVGTIRRATHYWSGLTLGCQNLIEEAAIHFSVISSSRFKLEPIDVELLLNRLAAVRKFLSGELDDSNFLLSPKLSTSLPERVDYRAISDKLLVLMNQVEKQLRSTPVTLDLDPSTKAMLMMERGIHYALTKDVAKARRYSNEGQQLASDPSRRRTL